MFRIVSANRKNSKWLLKGTALGVLTALFSVVAAHPLLGADQHKKQAKKPSVEIPADPDINTRTQMVEWSRQLGVTCVHCHNLENFKSFEKKPMTTAKEHAHWVALLNSQGTYRGSPKVDCFMCHRGLPIPDYKEKTEK